MRLELCLESCWSNVANVSISVSIISPVVIDGHHARKPCGSDYTCAGLVRSNQVGELCGEIWRSMWRPGPIGCTRTLLHWVTLPVETSPVSVSRLKQARPGSGFLTFSIKMSSTHFIQLQLHSHKHLWLLWLRLMNNHSCLFLRAPRDTRSYGFANWFGNHRGWETQKKRSAAWAIATGWRKTATLGKRMAEDRASCGKTAGCCGYFSSANTLSMSDWDECVCVCVFTLLMHEPWLLYTDNRVREKKETIRATRVLKEAPASGRESGCDNILVELDLHKHSWLICVSWHLVFNRMQFSRWWLCSHKSTRSCAGFWVPSSPSSLLCPCVPGPLAPKAKIIVRDQRAGCATNALTHCAQRRSNRSHAEDTDSNKQRCVSREFFSQQRCKISFFPDCSRLWVTPYFKPHPQYEE